MTFRATEFIDPDEYLRRNLLHASAVGAEANAKAALGRLRRMKRPPKWLRRAIEGVIERAVRVSAEMARHRDEMRKDTPRASS